MLGDEVVGTLGAYGVRWIGANGATFASHGGSDLVVRPQDRKRALAQRLFEALTDDLGARGHRYIVGLSASRITHLVLVRQGWVPVVEFAYAERPAPARRLPDFVARLRRPRAISIEPVVRSSEMAQLRALAAPPSEAIRHVRDESFYDWRFRNPFSRYRFLYWHESSTLAAYLVIQQRSAAPGRIALVDWAFLSPEAMTGLVRAALDLAGTVPAVVTLGGHSEVERAIFREAGFIQRPIAEGDPFRPALLVKRLGSGGTGASAEDDQPGHRRWWSHPIDGDGF
jgi:GNAT superfamily N-acetyltransferase